MLNKVKVYGRLARFLGERTFEAEVKTPIDAFKFLLANFPHLERHMIEQTYQVKVGKVDISEDNLLDPLGQQEIKIIPVVVGAKNPFKGLGKVLTGIAIVGAVAFTGGFGTFAAAGGGFSGLGFAAGAGAGLGASLAAAAGNIGIFLALSGAAEMLTPVPKPPGVSDDPQSSQNFSFSGVQNTSRAGTAIPIIYGEIFAGSLVVSAGIDTVQIKGTA